MDIIDKRYTKINKLYTEKKYQEAICFGKIAVNQPMDNKCKADICQYVAGANYALGNIRDFIYWKSKAVDLLPQECWKERLTLWGHVIFSMHYLPDITDAELAQAHFKAQDIVSNVPYIFNEDRKKEYAHTALSKSNKKIRLGYISSDFHNHVSAKFFIQLLGAYDRNEFEVHCYSVYDRSDHVTEFIKTLITEWHDVYDLDSENIARQIYQDKIDILIDLSIYSNRSRTAEIVAFKPAPIIVAGIGYMSTSGIKAVDYFLTDAYCDPVGMGDEHFSEKLLRLPYTHFCYTQHESVLDIEPNTKVHNPIVFGSLNHYHKINDDVLKSWKNIMDRVPNAKLITQSSGPDYMRSQIRDKMINLGFDMSRIELRPGSEKYHFTYKDIDIVLDSFPYTGGGTTFDALNMGCPVITRYGTRHGNRFGYSIMKNLGLEELTASTWQEYEDIAVTLAQNPDVVEALHGSIKNMMKKSPLMDARLYVNSVEAAYKKIWRAFLQEY